MDRVQKRLTGVDDEDSTDQNLFYRQASSKMFNKSNLELTEITIDGLVEPNDYFPTSSDEICIAYRLPYLQAVLFSCILEDCMCQLRVLDECNNELRIFKTMSDMDNLRAKKFEIKQTIENDETLANLNSKDLNRMSFKLDKFAADRLFCVEVLTATYLELSLHRCFSTIVENNNTTMETEAYRFELIEEAAKNKATRRELSRQIRQQRNHFKTVAYDTELIIDQLRSNVEDAALNSETKTRYIDNWQRARTEQHEQSIRDREAGPSDTIKYYARRTDQEQRIHSEVEMLVTIFINETLTKVEKWMSKYDLDMEAIDLKIQIMKNKYQQEVDKRVEMEQRYALHESLMKNWINFKEERRKAREYVEKMTTSAIIVQAWWRGILVRLELGPFKPPKKAKAPGKKKK